LVFLFICIFLLLLSIILFSSSKIIIEITNLRLSSNSKKYINKDHKLAIKLCILGKVPIFNINIEETRLKKLRLSAKIENAKLERIIVKELRKVNFGINNIDLNVQLGTEEIELTAVLVSVISTIISMLLKKHSTKNASLNFKVTPIYNKNIINIELSGIIEFKMIHITNIICMLSKKEGISSKNSIFSEIKQKP